MKKRYTALTTAPLLAAFLILTPAMAKADLYNNQPGDLGFHLGADAGISVMQDFSSGRLGFPGRFSTWPGSRVDVAPEFDFFSAGPVTLGADFETGALYNEIHRISDAGELTYAHGEYYQVPFVGDFVLRIHPDSFVAPYVGVGGGGDFSRLRINSSGFFGPPMRDNRVDPAVQGMAGVLFRLNPMIELGLSYKMLAAFPGGNQNTFAHTVLATLNFKFW